MAERKRRYDTEGTKDFVFWAVILLAIGLWHVWDGWFPREAVLARHPSPEDSFYMYNKIVGVLGITGAAICGYIHAIVK